MNHQLIKMDRSKRTIRPEVKLMKSRNKFDDSCLKTKSLLVKNAKIILEA